MATAIAHRAQHGVAVVGVQQRHVGLERAVEATGRQPVQRFQPVVPHCLTCAHVPPPRPQPAGTQRGTKVLGQISRPLLGETQLRHILRGPDDRNNGAGGAEHRPSRRVHADRGAVAAHDHPIAHRHVPRCDVRQILPIAHSLVRRSEHIEH